MDASLATATNDGFVASLSARSGVEMSAFRRAKAGGIGPLWGGPVECPRSMLAEDLHKFAKQKSGEQFTVS